MKFDTQVAYSHIRHRRFAVQDQRANAFSYRMAYVLVNLDTVAESMSRSPLWGFNRFAALSLYPSDWFSTDYAHFAKRHVGAAQTNQQATAVRHAQDTKRDVIEAINQQYAASMADNPLAADATTVMLLTLPRYFNIGFNPVSFYFVYEADKTTPSFIVSDITNTPWNQRHAYIHDCRNGSAREYASNDGSDANMTYHFDFSKVFHVSPFMPMDVDYAWRFHFAQDRLVIHMRLLRNDEASKPETAEQTCIFDATMDMTLAPLTPRLMHGFALRFPLQSLKIVAGIYWQALKIKLKGNRFYPHPHNDVQAETAAAFDAQHDNTPD